MTHSMDSVPMPEPEVLVNGGWPIKVHSIQQLKEMRLSAYEAGRNAGLEEQAKAFDEEAFRTVEPNIKAMLLGFAAALRKDKR